MKLPYRFNKPKYIYEVKQKNNSNMGSFFTTRTEARTWKNNQNIQQTSAKFVIYRHEINMTNKIIR